MTTETQIERCNDRLERVEEIINILEILAEHKDSDTFDYWVAIDDTIQITIKELSDISKARKLLREVLGDWADGLAYQFVSGLTFYSTWRHKTDKYPIEIMYECPLDSIQPELTKPGCRVIEVNRKEKQYVCGIKD